MTEARKGGNGMSLTLSMIRWSSVLRRRVAYLVDLVDTPAEGGQDDQETDRGDDRAQYVTAIHVIGIGAGGLHPAAGQGQGTQPDGEQRGQAGPGKHAEHHDLPDGGEIDPAHFMLPVSLRPRPRARVRTERRPRSIRRSHCCDPPWWPGTAGRWLRRGRRGCPGGRA